MGQITSVGQIYGVETDVVDWPKGLPTGEREVLIALVRETIQRWQAVGKHPGTYDLYQQVKHAAEKRDDVPTFRSGALLDWLYACVVRAARAANAEQVWSIPPPVAERWVTFKLDLIGDPAAAVFASKADALAKRYSKTSVFHSASWAALASAVRRTIRAL